MCKVFFFCCAPLGAATFRRGRSKKKNTTQGIFFFAAATAKGTGRRSPVGRRHGARAKKKTFCSGPVPAPNGASPSPAFPRGRSKKKKHPGPVPPNGASPSLAFRAQRGFSFPCLSPTGLLLPVPFARAAAKKKKYPGWCFFFAAAPRGRSLTHCGPGWRCLPLGGVVFFFAAAPPGPGWCYFFFAVAPPGRSLTHGGLGRFRQGPGSVIFLLRPRRVFLDNNKKCLGYYIGSKKTRRGHSKKKTPLPPKTY